MNNQNGQSWYCVGEECNHVLGYVVGSEFTPASTVPHANIQTRGTNLSVKCPNCSTTKIWYTSDAINRAINQLIDAVVSVLTVRVISAVGPAVMDAVRGDSHMGIRNTL